MGLDNGTVFLLQIITNATLWTDAFLLISGFLCAHNVLRNTRNVSIKNYKPLTNIIHRYLRLTPSLIGIISFSILQEITASGPFWSNYIKKSEATCHKNWWTNILYINNLVSYNKVGQNETQVSVIQYVIYRVFHNSLYWV
jgi:peptidoglycan/LPS O-acetylase OafA/YrhL